MDFLQSKGHFNLNVHECFYVHPDEVWLEPSPDDVVHDLTAADAQGILEIKCSYTVRNCTITEACKDTMFYCFCDGTSMFTTIT